jgi:non-ribosomal peptide synthetase component F
VIENYPLEKSLAERTAGGLAIAGYSMVERTHYDFTLIINVIDDVEANFYYNNRLFSDGAVGRLAGHFRNILEALVSEPGGELSEIDILPAEEKKQLLLDFNAAEAAYPTDKTLHQLFEEQVSKTPDKIAVIGMGELTYNELNNKCDTLARLLIEKGIGSGSIVALMVDRSPEMVIGILGILKAGAAYLPIDPGYPGERIQYILNDSNTGILVSKVSKVSRDIEVIELSKIIGPIGPIGPIKELPTQLCYIIYTSGSTGKPKGVMVEHRSVVNTLWACQAAYPLLETDTYLLKTTYTFDVSVAELFGWYPGGGRLAILGPGGEKDTGLILDTIERCGVTHINFVPSMFNVFLDSLNPRNMGKLYLGWTGRLPWRTSMVLPKPRSMPVGIR